jgi:hypothetical protein
VPAKRGERHGDAVISGRQERQERSMSPETTLIIILVFGTAAIASSLVVLKTWLLERRMAPVAYGWAVCTTAVLMAGLLAAHYSAPQRLEYRATGGAPQRDVAPTVPRYSAPWLRSRWSGIVAERLAEQSRVDDMHRKFAPALEQYRQTHGKYPPTLEDAGIETPVTRYGPLHYYGTGTWYLISFGDIERDRFSSDWDSRKRTWSLVELDF